MVSMAVILLSLAYLILSSPQTGPQQPTGATISASPSRSPSTRQTPFVSAPLANGQFGFSLALRQMAPLPIDHLTIGGIVDVVSFDRDKRTAVFVVSGVRLVGLRVDGQDPSLTLALTPEQVSDLTAALEDGKHSTIRVVARPSEQSAGGQK